MDDLTSAVTTSAGEGISNRSLATLNSLSCDVFGEPVSGVCEKPKVLFYDVYVTPEIVQSFNNGSFSDVEVIFGNVNVDEHYYLTDLSFLRNVKMIGGYLYIRENNALTSLSGLDSVTIIGTHVSIIYNGALTSLNGLGSLTAIGGYVNIYGNSVLTSLNGLDSVTTIGGYVNIYSNSGAGNTAPSNIRDATQECRLGC